MLQTAEEYVIETKDVMEEDFETVRDFIERRAKMQMHRDFSTYGLSIKDFEFRHVWHHNERSRLHHHYFFAKPQIQG